MTGSKPYTSDIEQDELILAAIIAGGMSSGRRVAPSSSAARAYQAGHTNGWGVNPWSNVKGPCCAVGAGLLYAGITRTMNVLSTFAKAHGVARDYGSGVSAGFEGLDGTTRPMPGYLPVDYERGVAVGVAAYDFFQGERK
jgi:hypothetical protein